MESSVFPTDAETCAGGEKTSEGKPKEHPDGKIAISLNVSIAVVIREAEATHSTGTEAGDEV